MVMATSPRLNPWVVRFKSKPQAIIRLFCFPYAGGSATVYRSWPAGLPDTVEVCSVEIPGRGNRTREPLFKRLQPLVESAAAALKDYLDMPFAFFGHSMGAMICFELARQLRREHGLSPVHLFASGRRAPQIMDSDSSTYDLPEPEFLDELRRLNGTPKEAFEYPELIQFLLPLLRGDFEVVQTYEYSPDDPLDCPVTVFGGLQDPEVSRENLEPWRDQTLNQFSLRMLPGDHFFLRSAEPLLLQMIAGDLYKSVKRLTKQI